MKTLWTKGLNEQEALDIKASFNSCALVRKRLQTMLKEKSESSISTRKDDYDCPNWAYKQADNIGYLRALKEISSLLE